MTTNIEINSSIYAYKVRSDNGGAPCVQDGMLSLCICKPALRRVAQPGDWVIGVGALTVKKLRGRIIYIAKVTQALVGSEYYNGNGKWVKRPDCIYRHHKENGADKYTQQGNPFHDCGEMYNDLGGAPGYKSARCLVSERGNFAYFGDGKGGGPSVDQVHDIVNPIKQGHRVWHDANDETYARLAKFISDVIEEYGYGKRSDPTTPAVQERGASCGSGQPQTKALMVCVGLDKAGGAWHPPCNSQNGEFVYIPALQSEQGGEAEAAALEAALQGFAESNDCHTDATRLPANLRNRLAQFNPDFGRLTYSDTKGRGEQLLGLQSGDYLFFCTRLNCIHKNKAVDAIIGLFIVSSVKQDGDIITVHGRKKAPCVKGSGRLRAYIDSMADCRKCGVYHELDTGKLNELLEENDMVLIQANNP